MRLLALSLLLVCGWRTHAAVSLWASDVRLWDHARLLAPEKARIALNAGAAHADSGDYRGACGLLAFASSAKIDPRYEWADLVQRAALIDLATIRNSGACQ